ncbi:TolC family protein [Winogradskyella sp.]|uniref:TolC family protein n=1 Tax=Winogradskyella sp. TaxID=1883156 RepID=UPI002607C4E9|nr:TolC family protein [Winogradskyella sp.]
MKYKTVAIFSSLLWFYQTNAQQITLITKEEVVSRVSKNNTSLKISEQSFQEAQADFRQTNTIFLPNIMASHTAIATTNPLMAFGSKLNQEILTQSDFNPLLLNDPSQIENYATKFEIQQPVINIDGIYQRKAAKMRMQAMEFQKQRTKEYLEFEVEKAYMQLQLTYKGVSVLEKVLEASQANLKLANDRFKQGYLQRADVLAVEVRVTEVKNQLQTAKSNVANASNYLSYLMDDKTYILYQPADSLQLIGYGLKDTQTVSEDRADVKAMELTSDAYESISKADRMSFLPRLNAFGSYELFDDKIFQANASGYTFGAQLSWNIFEGSKRFGKAQKSKATYEKSQLEYKQYRSQSQLELNKANRMLIDTKNKLELTALALSQSEESLRIRINRFKEGLEKTSDLLLAETLYAQKQLEYFQTVFEYNNAQSYLKFLSK